MWRPYPDGYLQFCLVKAVEAQMNHISSHLNPRQQGDFPSEAMANPKNEA